MRTDWEVLIYDCNKQLIDVYYIFDALEAIALQLAEKFIAENHCDVTWSMDGFCADFLKK